MVVSSPVSAKVIRQSAMSEPQELHPPAALGQHEVVGHRLVVVEEVVLDRVGPVAEAEDEVACGRSGRSSA